MAVLEKQVADEEVVESLPEKFQTLDIKQNAQRQSITVGSVASAGRGTTHVFGSINAQTVHIASKSSNRKDEEEPKQDDYRLPFSLQGFKAVPKFIGRQTYLDDIETFFSAQDETRHERKVFVLHGMGGIGKTQLAIRYARDHQDQYTAVLWIDGSTEESVKQSFSRYAQKLPGRPNHSRDQDEASTNSDVQKVLEWLSIPENDKWLLVFDNIDRDFEATNTVDPLAYELEEYFPSADHGCILITSRLSSLEAVGRGSEINKMNRSQSLETLSNAVGKSLQDDSDVSQTLELLDGLPLALTLAGAYMKQTKVSFAAYNLAYRKEWGKLLNNQEKYKLREYTGKAMLTTWMLSFEQVKKESAESAGMLSCWAFLNNSLTPKLFSGLLTERYIPKIRPLVPQWLLKLGENLVFADTIQPLVRYSLATVGDDGQTFSLHPVLHDWSFNAVISSTSEQPAEYLQAAASLVASQVIVDMYDRRTSKRLREELAPHASKICQRLNQMKDSMEGKTMLASYQLPAKVFLHLGFAVLQYGDTSDADSQYQQVLREIEDPSQAHQAETVEERRWILNEIGRYYFHQGRFTEAKTLFERSIDAGTLEVSDEVSTVLFSAFHNLGLAYLALGDQFNGEQMLHRALRDEDIIPKHNVQVVFQALGNLVWIYLGQGRLSEAEETLNRVRKEASGLERKSIIMAGTYFDMARLYVLQGKLEDARAPYKKALKICDRTCGRAHRYTLELRSTLSQNYLNLGWYSEAEDTVLLELKGLQERFSRDHEKVFEATRRLESIRKKIRTLPCADSEQEEARAGS